MGNEQGVPVDSIDARTGFQRMGPQQRPPHQKQTPDHELLIVVRGLRRTGKTTLVTRMRGLPFESVYQATKSLEATEIPWLSPKKERVNVTSWDVVEKALLPEDSWAEVDCPDATTIDTLKRADGLVVMIDSHFEDTVKLAETLIVAAPDDLPILVFSNFMDIEDSSPVIPERLHKYMGRFYFIPGSLKTNQGLVEVSKWLTLPLLASKKKAHYSMYKALEEDLMNENVDFTSTAEYFVVLESAVQHMPKFIPIRAVESRVVREEIPESVDEIIPEPEPGPHVKKQPSEMQPQPQPVKKSYEKPYRRRQQQIAARPKVLAVEAKTKQKEEDENFWDSGDEDEKKAETYEPEQRTGRKRRRSSGNTKTSKKGKTPADPEPAPAPAPAPAPKPAPKPVDDPVPQEESEMPQDQEENEDDGAFWSNDDEEPEIEQEIVVEGGDDDDEEQLRPNPLVHKVRKSIDLVASIRSQEEQIDEQKKEMYMAPPEDPEPAAQEAEEPSAKEQPHEAATPEPPSVGEYGELEGTDSAIERIEPAAPQKKTFRKRQQFHNRRKMHKSSSHDEDE